MSHQISLKKAAAMTLHYRQNRQAILAPAYQNQDLLSLSETFNRDAIDALLAKPGCTAIRIYYGMDENLKVHAILVGSNAANEDILPGSPAPVAPAGEDESDYIAEGSIQCPPTCPEESPLNTP